MTGEAPNQLVPRQLACAYVAAKQAELDALILDYAERNDTTQLFHSQVLVFLHQTAVELGRAVEYLRTHDMADGDG